MAQGWTVDGTADTITFYEAPPAGANNISVQQMPDTGSGGTDVWAVGAWSGRYGYPSEVEFFSDRLWFAGTPTDPQTIWASCIGDYPNFGRSSPIVDSDTVTFVINARQVNTVKDLVPLDNLLVMTTGGEYKVTGGQDDVVSPSTIGVKNQGNAGSGDVQSKLIGESAIFIQEEGQKIRDLRYQFEKDGFRGNDLSVWADHLFAGYEVKGIEYWKAPWQVVWFTRDDGVEVGCTYMPEQEVVGWHWHDTDGLFLDACALPGKKESECYFLVQRVIDGEAVQCIEQLAPTRAETESDMWFVDCGLQYDGRNTGTGTIRVDSVGGWGEEDELTITATDALFVGAADVGDGFELWRDMVVVEDGVARTDRVSMRLVIDAYVDANHVVGRSIGTVPVELRGVALSSWTFQRDTIGNLWHLEGKAVSVLQDAAVAGPYVVAGGQISLATPGGVCNIGLPYTCEVETLELNAPGGEPMRDQNKLAYSVSILLLASRGVMAGGIRDVLYEIPERSYEDYGQPPFLKTGVFDCNIPAGWGVDAGRVRIVSDQPLPMEILSITTRAVSSNGQSGGGCQVIRARIVPATEAHAHAIAASPRAADLAELWASTRSDPLDAMLRGMERTAEPLTAIYDGRPACMFGASPFSIMGGMGSAWMIGSSVLNQCGAQKDLLRLSEPVVEYMQDLFPNLLYNFVDQRNTAAIRWLRWLGFQFSDPIPYGVDGLPFLPFYRRRGA